MTSLQTLSLLKSFAVKFSVRYFSLDCSLVANTAVFKIAHKCAPHLQSDSAIPWRASLGNLDIFLLWTCKALSAYSIMVSVEENIASQSEESNSH